MELPQLFIDYQNATWLYLPYESDNKQWLWTYNGWTRGKWDPYKKVWQVPKSRVEIIIDAAILKWGGIYVTRRHKRSVVCTSSCRTAKCELCECSCKGKYHKAGFTGTEKRIGWTLADDIVIDVDAGVDEVTWLATQRTGLAIPLEPKNNAQWRRFNSVGGYWTGGTADEETVSVTPDDTPSAPWPERPHQRRRRREVRDWKSRVDGGSR